MAAVVRVAVLGLIGRIWTKIDVDSCEELLVEFEGELGRTLDRISRGESKGNSDVFVYMLSCLLICVDLCEGEDDAMHALREYRSKSESERPLLFVISNRDTREVLHSLSGRLPAHLPDPPRNVRTDRGFDGRIGAPSESHGDASSHHQSLFPFHVIAHGILALDERPFDSRRGSFSTLLFHQEKGYDAPILCLMEHVAPYLRHRDLSSSFEFSQVVEETESFIPDEYRAVVGLRCGHDLVVGQPRGCEVDVGAASVIGDADDESFGSGGGVAGEAAGGVDERAVGEQPAGEAGREGVCVHGAGGGE